MAGSGRARPGGSRDVRLPPLREILFEYHNDALFVLQWILGIGAVLGSLTSRRASAPPPPLYESGPMKPVCDAVGKVAPTGATVVLRGEIGAGKELN